MKKYYLTKNNAVSEINGSHFLDNNDIQRHINWITHPETTQQDLVDAGVTVEDVLPEPLDINAEKSIKINEIKSHRDYLTLNGGHKIGNDWYHSNEISLIQQLVLDGMAKQMSAAGAPDSMSLPNIPAWKTMGNTFVQLTVGIAKNFVVSAMLQQGALFTKAQQKIAEVEALTDAEDVKAYNVQSDWPENQSNISQV